MKTIRNLFDRIDAALTAWMARYGILLLRLSLGIVFLWFGALKFFPGLSPAEDLAANTIARLTFGLVPASTAVFILATWESLIGIGLIFGLYLRLTLLLLWLQMLGTITPIFFFPNQVFNVFPFAPTLEGQYIFKNIVLVSAGLVIGATVRGGRVVADPEKIKGRAKENLA
ncbi:MAG: DoxX family membrane protein [Anaerolineales bacterium]